VDDPGGRRVGSCSNQLAHGVGVDRLIGGFRYRRVPVDGCDVVDDLHVFYGPAQIGTLFQSSYYRFNASRFETGSLDSLAHEATDVVASTGECARKMTPGESASAGD
jgi:hypothetical protein